MFNTNASASIPFLVGAYASLPERDQQPAYYQLLARQDWIDGLEIPFPGDLQNDWAWLADQLSGHWTQNSITAIPGTMQNVGKNSSFGLASPEPDGRAAAMKMATEIAHRVSDVCDRLSRKAFARVQLHAAPPRISDLSALRRSLEELRNLDWSGAELVIEHCDHYVDSHNPEKGFLAIDDEIKLAAELGMTVTVNWGRSVLEARNVDQAYAHIAACQEGGVLAGVMFSGVSPEPTPYGYAWIDGHVPATPDEPSSLMTVAEISRCAQLARDGEQAAHFLGAKICVPAQASLDQRLAMLETIHNATLY